MMAEVEAESEKRCAAHRDLGKVVGLREFLPGAGAEAQRPAELVHLRKVVGLRELLTRAPAQLQRLAQLLRLAALAALAARAALAALADLAALAVHAAHLRRRRRAVKGASKPERRVRNEGGRWQGRGLQAVGFL